MQDTEHLVVFVFTLISEPTSPQKNMKLPKGTQNTLSTWYVWGIITYVQPTPIINGKI